MVHCMSRNISEGGMGLRSVNSARVGQEFEIRFRIPGEQQLIEGRCEARWIDQAGNAGISFVQMPGADFKRLKEWINQQFEETPPSLIINSVKKKA
jgi:c-di-GMP-binding flagellar brake protein YcgR